MLALTTNNFINPRHWVLACLVSVSSCSFQPTPEDTFDDFRERLNNITGGQWSQSAYVAHFIDNPQSKKESSPFSNKQQTINLNEFHRLPECGLKPLIAERNTSLGKLQSPSLRLDYEIRLQKALEQCLEILPGTSHPQINEFKAKKMKVLATAVEAMVSNSVEIKTSVLSAGVYIGTDTAYRESDLAWQYLSERVEELSQPHPLLTNWQISETENHLKALAQQKLLARANNTMRLFIDRLPTITQAINNLSAQVNCEHPSQKQKVTYLRNVFRMYFIEQLQPIAGMVNDMYYRTNESISTIYQSEYSSNDLANYLDDAYFSAFPRFKSSILDHVTAWQTLFKQCDVNPAG